MDELLKLAVSGGPWVLVVAAFAWAYLRDTRMAIRLDEMQSQQREDFKGVIAANTEAMQGVRTCVSEMQAHRVQEVRAHEEQARSTRILADQVERIANRVQCANMTPAHGVPRVGRNGD